MKKKLIAIAVAGALGAPAVALAQSTVQIYGKITYEYAWTDEGAGRQKTDVADTPGGSAIGFKGEEKLGGGLSAWFQCETSADVRGGDQVGLCSRNSAIGAKGGFGNVYFGRWDTPFKRALNVGSVGAQETGPLGASFMAFGGSGGADATASSPNAISPEGQNRARWKRRETAMSSYDSPKFGGFQVLAGISTGSAAVSTTTAAPASNNSKPRVYSIAGVYEAGPLGLSIGYEKHAEFGTLGGASDLDDSAWGITGAYKFGPVKLGATYLDAQYETAPGLETKKRTYTVGMDWTIAGPHGFEAQWVHAEDSKGNGGAIQGTSRQGVAAPVVAGVARSDTGGDQFSIAYRHNLSKRTDARLIYTKIQNDNNSFYALGSATPNTGQDMSAFGFYVSHRF